MGPGGRRACGRRALRPVGATRGPWLVRIAAVAAFLRLQLRFDLVPRGFWADESIAAVQAQDILEHGWRPLFIGGANGEPALYLYGIAAMLRLFGPRVWAVRLPMAVARGRWPWSRLGGSRRRCTGGAWRWSPPRCWR